MKASRERKKKQFLGSPLENDIYAWHAFGPIARVAEPGTATEPERFRVLGVEPRDRKELDQVSCWSFGPRGFKSHPGRLTIARVQSRNVPEACAVLEKIS